MRGFVVFEWSPPCVWKPRASHLGPFKRWMWLYFSFSIFRHSNLTTFIERLLNEPPPTPTGISEQNDER